MIIVAIIGILGAIGAVNYGNSVRRSAEAFTKGNLGAIRSAISIYYSDNDAIYPADDLSSLANNTRYLLTIPLVRTLPLHSDMNLVTAESATTDVGGWSYDNSDASATWGAIRVGCLHQDMRGETWSTY